MYTKWVVLVVLECFCFLTSLFETALHHLDLMERRGILKVPACE